MLALRETAREAIERGESHAEVLRTFDVLRHQLADQGDEEKEDAVLEVMDFIVGWCGPQMRL